MLLSRPAALAFLLVPFHAFRSGSGPVAVASPVLDGPCNENETSWHQYIRGPSSRVVRPKLVLSAYTSGNVSNEDGMIAGAGEPTVFNRQNSTDDVPTVIIDFGLNVVGLLTLEFTDAVSYAQEGYPGMSLSFSETLEFLTNRSDFTRSDNADTADLKLVPSGTDQIAVAPGKTSWVDQWGCAHGNQVCSDGLHGFRFVKVELNALPSDAPHTTSAGSVSISSVSVQFSGFLGTPDTYTGHFECSDPDLSQWWYDGAYTTELGTDIFRSNDTEPRQADSPSLLGKMVILDGAKRDRDPYVGDLAVSGLTSYLTHDTQEAIRNVLEDLGQHQRSDGWIPPASIRNYQLPLFDYPMWWVSCSWDYVYYTGNTSYLDAYYGHLISVLDTYYPTYIDANTSLLVRPDGYGDYAFLNRPGSAAYYSALYVLALNRGADFADLLSRPEDAARWRQRAATLADAFVPQLWDTAANAFFDRRCANASEGCNAHAQDGNSLAVMSNIVPANSSMTQSLLSYLQTANYRPYGNAFYDSGGNAICGDGCSGRVYAFISYLELSARFMAGQTNSALDQIRRTYGWMASHEPGVTQWEGIGEGGVPYEGAFTSMAHGWSTGIVPLMSNYILGVKPTKPGFEVWEVRPQTGNLTWARGEVPTPQGPLKVSWKRGQGNTTMEIVVVAPNGTSGTIGVPLDGNDRARVTLDGVTVWSEQGNVTTVATTTADDGFVVVQVQGGERHRLACTIDPEAS